FHADDVHRRPCHGSAERLIRAFPFAESQLSQKLTFEPFVFGDAAIGELLIHGVVEAGDAHTSVGRAQRSEKLREAGGGIDGPIAVMTAVQSARRPEQRDLGALHAAHSENDLRAPRLVPRAIGEEQKVGGDHIGVLADDLREMLRADFFLSIEKYFQIDRQRLVAARQRVERREQRDDRGLVVGGGAQQERCEHGGHKESTWRLYCHARFQDDSDGSDVQDGEDGKMKNASLRAGGDPLTVFAV
ncbi:MAG: hypothetical protein ACRETT_10340, partial [Steroidobacteraceae bacterium]